MKLGFFFGAGAEISYGLPSGGRFAIELFKTPVEEYKKKLREHLRKIDLQSSYASWFPKNFEQKPVYAFGKSEFSSILQSTIEYKGRKILENIKDLDGKCSEIIKENNINEKHVEDLYRSVMNKEFCESTYENVIQLNEVLSMKSPKVNLFSSLYYSALLDIINKNKSNTTLKRYASALLQLYICVIGSKVIDDLNQELFQKNETNLSIFDDMTSNFNMDFGRLGSVILDIVMDNNVNKISDPSITDFEKFLEDLFAILIGRIFEDCIDYRKLIDEHFRYLYTPKTQWAKFTKMVIFLRIAREYILNEVNISKNNSGYYHDLNNFSHDVVFNAIGTSNYNSIIHDIASDIDLDIPDVKFLNGSVNSFYNPYKNSIVEYDSSNNDPYDQEQLVVPFILTQSGLKPLTSVSMSEKYVSLYHEYQKSDAIVCIGFGFNSDDAHINGIFRQLLDDDKKHLFYITIENNESNIKRNIKDNIRIEPDSLSRIHIITVDADRKYNGRCWSELVELEVKNIT